MSLTNLPISPEDGWKEITDVANGVFTLSNGGEYCLYTGQPPVDLMGHRYVGKQVKFTTNEGVALYVKVSRACTAVLSTLVTTVTPPSEINSPGVWNISGVWN